MPIDLREAVEVCVGAMDLCFEPESRRGDLRVAHEVSARASCREQPFGDPEVFPFGIDPLDARVVEPILQIGEGLFHAERLAEEFPPTGGEPVYPYGWSPLLRHCETGPLFLPLSFSYTQKPVPCGESATGPGLGKSGETAIDGLSMEPVGGARSRP